VYTQDDFARTKSNVKFRIIILTSPKRNIIMQIKNSTVSITSY